MLLLIVPGSTGVQALVYLDFAIEPCGRSNATDKQQRQPECPSLYLDPGHPQLPAVRWQRLRTALPSAPPALQGHEQLQVAQLVFAQVLASGVALSDGSA